uniref:Uncharacterized protein n=1 Tax=Arion vulgaris TaxID=1028688 RepID=A0A0B7B8J9_9EUPU
MAEEVDMEDVPIESVSNGHSNETDVNIEHANGEQVPEREITLTDHLNKKLLETFLQRLNKNEVPAAVGVNYMTTESEIEEEEIHTNETEWESDVSKAHP